MDCNQNLIPLIFLHDVNGFMVGREAEYGGIIKAGAKLVNVVSNSVVPKITVIVGGSFGAGHYAMCGKAYGPRFIYAWPTARYAVMGGDQAAGTLVDIKLKQLERSGQSLGEAEKRDLFESAKKTCTITRQIHATAPLACGWIKSSTRPKLGISSSGVWS
jgi:acetyl-CoA carboxylase carboxyltransferase component